MGGYATIESSVWQNVASNTRYFMDIDVYRAKIDLYKDAVREYAATLRKPADDYSRVLPHVPADALAAAQSPLIEARIRMAEAQIKLELRSELMRIGFAPTVEQLDKMIGAIPREDFYRLIAARA